MAKVTCEKCGSEKIAVVNQIVEKKQKENTSFFLVVYLASLVGIIVGVITSMNPSIYTQIPPISLIIGSFFLLIITCFVQMLIPVKYENKVKCVCLDCGKTWFLEEEKEPEQKKKKSFFSI